MVESGNNLILNPANTAGVQAIAQLIAQAKHVVILTGAGISTESGIPDFRGPQGLWGKFDVQDILYDKFLEDEANREKFWEFSRKLWPSIANARPNAGHNAIAELHRIGKLSCLITQNIDGLHQIAGVPDEKVIEIHGTGRVVACLDCGKRYRREDIQVRLESGEKVPRCDCSGLLKSLTVSFGQPIPKTLVQEAEKQAILSDVFLAAGSSLSVYPAARLPLKARENGAKLCILNLTPTPHDPYADVIINQKLGCVLPAIVAEVKAKLQ